MNKHYVPVEAKASAREPNGRAERKTIEYARQALRDAVLGRRDTISEHLVACDLALYETRRPRACLIVPMLLTGGFDATGTQAALAVMNVLDALPDNPDASFHFIPHFLGAAIVGLVFAAAEEQRPSQPDMVLPDGFRGDCFNTLLLHDILHPGGDNRGIPLLLEEQSYALAEDLLANNGYARGSLRLQRMLDALPLTEPKYGRPLSWQLTLYHNAATDAEREEAKAALDAMIVAHASDPALSDEKRLLLKNLKERGLKDPIGALQSTLVNEADVFASKMEKTYMRNCQLLTDEHIAVGGQLRAVDADGRISVPCAKYFFTVVADTTREHPNAMIRAIEKDEPQTVFAMAISGGFDGPGHPACYAGKPGALTLQ